MIYRVLVQSKLEPKAVAGALVYSCNGSDYGCARDDEAVFGYPCISVTLNPDGSYPFFVMPVHDLERA